MRWAAQRAPCREPRRYDGYAGILATHCTASSARADDDEEEATDDDESGAGRALGQCSA